MELVVTCLWSAAVAVLIHRAIAQRNLFEEVQPVDSDSDPPTARILVIVPARNESLNISACIEGLTRQTYPSGKRVVRIVDDHSNDDTAQIARAAASPHAGFSVVASPPLPPRWVGKCHACWVGATRDIDDPPEWLCFIDADVVAEPELLAAALQHAEAQSVDLLSLAPKQILGTWTERLVLPCGLYCLSFCQDFERLRTDECRDTSVTGQFLLVRAEAYYAVGGHRAVSDAICEDLALARQFKQHGRRIALFGGRELLSSRMYRDWSSMKIGLAKNLVETFGGKLRTTWIAFGAVVLAWAAIAIPLLDAWGCARGAPLACGALGLALASSGAAFGLHFAGARFFAIPLWYGLLFPLGYSLGALIAVDSLFRHFRRRFEWKGRVYP
ncbi:glycosyltransferase family 2 protein [Methylocystis sp. IM3]|uniref:glycosyltransferase n=1 Tax=unclassified Methylocystis TaxID=2625913 RepID=UPI00311A3717